MTESDWISPEGDDPPQGAAGVHVTIRMQLPAEMYKEARSVLTSMVERIRLEEGCLSCRLYQDALEGNILMYQEIWGDENLFRKHLRSGEFRNVLLVVEMAEAPPAIRCDRIAGSVDLATLDDGQESSARLPRADRSST